MNKRRRYESPLRAEQLEQTRQRIFQTLTEAIADETVEELTIPLVARRAKIAVRTVYRHFPTREELFGAWGDWAQAHLHVLMLSYPDTLEGLRRTIPELYRSYDEHEALIRAMLNSKAALPLRRQGRAHRFSSVETALAEVTAASSPTARRRAVAVLYLLVSAPAWQAMREQAGLDGAEAGEAAAWAVRVLTDALHRDPEGPAGTAAT
ncbi:TetR/AcrR family transcriptional regulator [Streptomyces sp. ISL-43]|uniref:TetR/AcrR family transcriptional regulator n=1 Tax=Streptomyces sp. ISL-43 TaxID=2819183 RepID=UPI001BEA7BE7|nr:TetR/AcrR family transcriptional regulator [Streptomyces sp. ISL-43]MBT2445616.1 TetR/AcrR family transcriptional regulator [Streptomyces sp. ISL-43]